ncbi:unnamed protein product [Moneuplotes crassus]|uniref:Uncharacterized protein n=1 Tax=Euplotes crassus TaxID=5936 RepID=A0AAD1UT81_EUPCR|nr:unnamed protein product [Moneuplotes crassus]
MSNRTNLFITQDPSRSTKSTFSRNQSLPSLKFKKSSNILEYKRKLQAQLDRIKEGNEDIQKASGMTQLWKEMRNKTIDSCNNLTDGRIITPGSRAASTGNVEDLKSCAEEPEEEKQQRPTIPKRNQSVLKMKTPKLARDVLGNLIRRKMMSQKYTKDGLDLSKMNAFKVIQLRKQHIKDTNPSVLNEDEYFEDDGEVTLFKSNSKFAPSKSTKLKNKLISTKTLQRYNSIKKVASQNYMKARREVSEQSTQMKKVHSQNDTKEVQLGMQRNRSQPTILHHESVLRDCIQDVKLKKDKFFRDMKKLRKQFKIIPKNNKGQLNFFQMSTDQINSYFDTKIQKMNSLKHSYSDRFFGEILKTKMQILSKYRFDVRDNI